MKYLEYKNIRISGQLEYMNIRELSFLVRSRIMHFAVKHNETNVATQCCHSYVDKCARITTNDRREAIRKN